jgi:biotin synthase
MKTFDDLLQQTRFDRDDLKRLLNARETEAEKLRQRALAVKFAYLDNHVHLRGLVELSNICRKDCLYCGLRRSNTAVARYTVSDEEVLDCARLAMELGYGSMAIQCGERSDRPFTDRVTRLVREIKRLSDNSIGITLSCGEQSENVYREWFEAGAHRYLLRIESSDKSLYEKIHPQDETHNFERRLACIDSLLKTGYQTGTGVMVGLPFQTLDHLVHDLLFFQEKDVAMVGLGPFLPHPDTPLWAFREQIPSPEERMRLTLNMISTLRLMMPEINMVAATATQTLDPQGREKAIEAGANVIMPNLTPQQYREEYLIYPDKAGVSDTPQQCRESLDMSMKSIGHEILYNAWGDSVAFTKRAAQQGSA